MYLPMSSLSSAEKRLPKWGGGRVAPVPRTHWSCGELRNRSAIGSRPRRTRGLLFSVLVTYISSLHPFLLAQTEIKSWNHMDGECISTSGFWVQVCARPPGLHRESCFYLLCMGGESGSTRKKRSFHDLKKMSSILDMATLLM